jgi:DNA-directed RNA polymerase specialized sigma24 family protein
VPGGPLPDGPVPGSPIPGGCGSGGAPPGGAPPGGAPPGGAPPGGAPPGGVAPGGVPVAGPEAAESDADRALTALYQSHYSALVRLAALLAGDVNTAEDIVQDSFVAMHGDWSRLRDHDQAASYLRQAVVSRSRSILPHPAVTARSPAGQSAVICAIRALPARQREALVLRLYLDLTDGQVAAAMGIPRDAVRGHASLGMAALRAAR